MKPRNKRLTTLRDVHLFTGPYPSLQVTTSGDSGGWQNTGQKEERQHEHVECQQSAKGISRPSCIICDLIFGCAKARVFVPTAVDQTQLTQIRIDFLS